MSKSKRTVEKHLSKEHAIGHAKGKPIEEVRVQSLLLHPHCHAFAVQDPNGLPRSVPTPSAPTEPSLRAETPSHVNTEGEEEDEEELSSHAGIEDLTAQYLTSQQQWQEYHQRFLPDDDG